MKGHQDNDAATTELPLLTQLNIEADRLEWQFQTDHGQYILKVALLPSSPALLSIRGLSITSQYKHDLQRAYTEPEYASKLQAKFGWSDPLVETITCKRLSIAIKQILREGLTTNCCDNILPTALTLNILRYQDTNKRCYQSSAQETSEHKIWCNHSTRIHWRRKAVHQIKISMQRYN